MCALPSYGRPGIWVPLLLVFLRVVRGCGAGPEYGGAVILAVDCAPPEKRGLYGSWAPIGVTVGNLLAAGVFAVVSQLPKDEFLSWGWRGPVLLSIHPIAARPRIPAPVPGTAGLTPVVAPAQPLTE